jgi:hypothetical protein
MQSASSKCRSNSSSIAVAWRALLNSVEVTVEDSVALDLGRAPFGYSVLRWRFAAPLSACYGPSRPTAAAGLSFHIVVPPNETDGPERFTCNSDDLSR